MDSADVVFCAAFACSAAAVKIVDRHIVKRGFVSKGFNNIIIKKFFLCK